MTWRSQILKITMIGHAEVKLHHLKPQGKLYMDIILLCVTESKKANLKELSNNISEKRGELKVNEPVREQSERPSVDIVG